LVEALQGSGFAPDKIRAAAFGAFAHCKVKDVEVESNFTEAVKFCQQELKQSKLPFLFISTARAERPNGPRNAKADSPPF